MASQAEKEDWILEHLRYEYDMLNLTYELMHRDPVWWMYNISYESFAVHARVLREFLACKDNFNARELVPQFKYDFDNDLQGPFRKLDQQVLHSAKDRKIGLGKLNLSDCERICAWVRGGIEKFVAELGEPLKGDWLKRDQAFERFMRGLTVPATGANEATASTYSTSTSSSSITSTSSTFRRRGNPTTWGYEGPTEEDGP